MADIAGWIALAATCIGAVMTAANLGARVTGWGFVVFTVGAAAWIAVGLATGQTQLLWSNIFLAVVDLIGIWRWLGRRARFGDVAEAERNRSAGAARTPLFSMSTIDGLPVIGADGTVIAHAVDAMATSNNGTIDFFIVRDGGVAGVGQTLRRLPLKMTKVSDAAIHTRLTTRTLANLTPAADAR